MTFDTFRWPDDMYEPGRGLLPASLSSNPGRERLWQHVRHCNAWPENGRLEFYATILYCLRTQSSPGAALTMAVREKKWGSRAWFAPQDRRAAAATIGTSIPPQVTAAAPAAGVQRDWAAIDRQIDRLANDEALELLQRQGSEFACLYFLNAVKQQKRPHDMPTIRHALRVALDSRPRPSAPAAPVCTPGLDLAGLDIE